MVLAGYNEDDDEFLDLYKEESEEDGFFDSHDDQDEVEEENV